MKRIVYFAAILALFHSAHAFTAADGPRDGGGGNEVGIEFNQAARAAVINVKGELSRHFPDLQAFDFESLLAAMEVLAVEEPLFVEHGGIRQEVTAINFPDRKLIKVNILRWRELVDLRLREGLALHEVLSLGGKEWTGRYPYSGLYVSRYGYAPEAIFGSRIGRPIQKPAVINKIYSYKCRKNFLEGESVSLSGIGCSPHQHLGFIFAEYQFNLFRSEQRDNFDEQIRQTYYPLVCGLRVPELSCGFAPTLQYGLSAERTEDFPTAISLKSGPENLAVFGYASMPDAKGKCGRGLVAAYQYEAQPATVFEPYPSTFVNTSNALNGRVIETVESAPYTFDVYRQPANTPCDGSGTCGWPDGEFQKIQSATYSRLSPKICVIPKEDL